MCPRFLVLTALLAACGGSVDTSPVHHGSASLRVSKDVTRSDTVLARVGPFQVQVIGADGKLATGIAVTFTTVGSIVSAPASAVTDASGTASTTLQFTSHAGAATLDVAVPSLSLSQSFTFAAQPGQAKSLQVRWRDSTLMVGDTLLVFLPLLDAYGNGLATAAHVEPIRQPSGFTLSSDGISMTVTGKTPGRFIARVLSGAFVDTLRLTVFPADLVGWYPNVSLNAPLMVSRLDNTHQRRVAILHAGFGVYDDCLEWTPAGDRVVYSTFFNGIRSAGMDGSESAYIKRFDTPIGTVDAKKPVAHRNGLGFYFTDDIRIWSRSWNDTTLQLRLDARPNVGYASLSSSWDGTRLLFGAGNIIEVWDSRTGKITTDGTAGKWPRFSPGDSLIGYITDDYLGLGQLHVMRSDGTGKRTIGDPQALYIAVLSWSPDGRYILVSSLENSQRDPYRFWLVDVASGEPWPLDTVHSYTEWACRVWRPIPGGG